MSAIGIDIGGTHLRAAWVSAEGRVLASHRERLEGRAPPEVAAHVQHALTQLPAEARQGDAPVGIGLAAQLDGRRGFVVVSPNLGWADIAFGETLSTALRRPVRLINDLNAIAVGEARAGAGQGERDLICVFVGTGVGMGVVANGALLEGARGLAGELGHLRLDSSRVAAAGGGEVAGRLCGCGARGCVETYLGGAHLAGQWQAQVAAGHPSALAAAAIDAVQLEEAAAAGDPAARAVWDEGAEVFGRALATAVTLFNPAVVILGGGVWEHAPSLRTRVRERFLASVTPPFRAGLRLCDASLGDDAGVVGAALTALGGG